MAVDKHSSTEKNRDGSNSTVEWWTVSCDHSGCNFTAQGQRYFSESDANAALSIHVSMTH